MHEVARKREAIESRDSRGVLFIIIFELRGERAPRSLRLSPYFEMER